MRVDNWEHKLFEFIEQNKKTCFQLGEFDCCLFAAKAVEIMTGDNLYSEFLGKYKTPQGYLKLIKKKGFTSIENFVSSIFQEKNIKNVKRGDLVFMAGAVGVNLGLINAFCSVDGLIFVDNKEILKAWGV